MMTPAFNTANFNHTPDSPQLADGFIGMKIAAEQSILESNQTMLELHGTYRFSAEFCNRFRSLSYEIAIVCVDALTHIPVITNLQKDGFETGNRKYDNADPGFDETTEKSWFNVQVSLPMKLSFSEAGYHIFAIIGDQKSNVLRLRRKE